MVICGRKNGLHGLKDESTVSRSNPGHGAHRGLLAGAAMQAKIRSWLNLKASSWGWPARDWPRYGRGVGWKNSHAS